MSDLQAIASLANSITGAGILLYWVLTERKERVALTREFLDHLKKGKEEGHEQD